MVVDITKGEERDGGLMYYPPVKDAHVTVTSRFNGNTAEGTTNENGVVNINIRDLAVVEDGQGVNSLEDYFFNGSVTVRRDGYREFKTALIEVQGGDGLQVPAHPLDAGGPYPYLASFDDWDALYTKCDFPMTPKNDTKHAIGTTIYDLPEAGEATFELWVAELGDYGHLVAHRAQRVGNQDLVAVRVLWRAIGLRRVEERDALLVGVADELGGLRVVHGGTVGMAEPHAAQSDCRYLKSLSQCLCAHVFCPFCDVCQLTRTWLELEGLACPRDRPSGGVRRVGAAHREAVQHGRCRVAAAQVAHAAGPARRFALRGGGRRQRVGLHALCGIPQSLRGLGGAGGGHGLRGAPPSHPRARHGGQP